MKTTKCILFLAAALGCFTQLNAQEGLKMVLKNGSELNGYISRQRPGENFTFSSTSATIILPATEVSSITDNQVKYTNLSAEWAEWAEENNAFIGENENRVLVLSNIIKKNGTVNQVRILERGAKIKYYTVESDTHTLNWDTISVVKAETRSKELLSGVNRCYKLKSGIEYEGEYVEEVPGETVSLFNKNGYVDVFNTAEVLKDTRVGVNPNQSLFEQSSLLDVVELKKGGTYKGIIFERNYFEQPSDDYLLIQLEDDKIMSVKLDDIAEYRKETNEKYNPLIDVFLEENEFMLNRHEAIGYVTEEVKDVICFVPDTVVVKLQKGLISLETKLRNPLQSQQLKVLKAYQYKDKKKKSSFYGFTYEDIVKSAIQPVKVETSVNGTTKMDYNIPAPGFYVVYNPLTKVAIPFRLHN